MITFGVAVTDVAQYQRCAAAGIASVAAPGDLVLTRTGMSLQRAYNEILDEAVMHDDVEAVVLVHQDMRIECPIFESRLRAVLGDSEVGLIGVSGAIGSTSLAWWDGAEPVGCFGAEIDGTVSVIGERCDGAREVDVVDGTVLILSAWAARQVRFDRAFERDFHGYDTDIAFQVRGLGGTVMVADLWCVHERMGKIGARRGAWIRASLRFDRKWLGASLTQVPLRLGRRPPSVREQIAAEVIAPDGR